MRVCFAIALIAFASIVALEARAKDCPSGGQKACKPQYRQCVKTKAEPQCRADYQDCLVACLK
jgi:hypothetical protein